jgi:hypothetical protein
MKKTWLVAGLAALVLAAPAYAADPVVDGCEKFKADTAKQKDKCVEENAEIAKITCKTTADLNAAMKIFQKCGAKVVAAATSGGAKAGGTTAGKDDPPAKEAGSTREWKCKAVDPADNKDIAEASAPRLTQCMTALKEKVKATRCSAGTDKTEYLHQNWVVNAWSKPTKATVICK